MSNNINERRRREQAERRKSDPAYAFGYWAGVAIAAMLTLLVAIVLIEVIRQAVMPV